MDPAYVIKATVREDLCLEFEQFMRERHVQDVLATGAFVRSELYRTSPNEYLIVYGPRDRNALNEYIEKHAPTLRSESAKAFPEGIRLERTEWTLIKSWTAGEQP